MRAMLTNRLFATTSALVLIVLLAGPALAGSRDHMDGFFMRLSTGGAGAKTHSEYGGDRVEFSGSGVDLNLAFGGIVSPNLALHGTLFGWTVEDPDMELNGLKVGVDGDVTAAGFGVGLTYYAMPANLYVSGSIGSGRVHFDIHRLGEGDTDRGVMLDLTLGKEWWTGDNWGLGVAVGMTYHSFPDPDVAADWTGTSFGVRFTATRN